jgi:beta-mannosidase
MNARLSLVGCLLSVAMACAQEVHIPLNDGWSFCQVGKEQWRSADVPGVVQTDLLRHKLIPDFMLGTNIDSVQWVENEDWIYKRTLVANDTLLKHGHLDLVFKGLDTFAEVYLNDTLLGKADNMFRTWEWPIKELLNPGANELKVIFRSPIKEGAKLREAYGIQLPHDSDPSGVSPYIRKAAYQFGWDFCPRLVTSGVWQGVELRGWSGARITQAEVRWIDGDANVIILTEGERTVGRGWRCDLWLDGRPIGTASPHGEGGGFVKVLDGEEIPKWQPAGSGKAVVQCLEVRLSRGRRDLSRAGLPLARIAHHIRTRKDDKGQEFTAVVHGQPFFAKGCNLVPPDLLPTRCTDSAWVAQVRHMQRAGVNMVRVWAGGIYPPEAFYHACDTAGILVWQDFMVANLLPAEGPFERNLAAEAQEQVSRISKHPSLLLFCGNNELNVAWHNWGWQGRYGLHGPDSTLVIDPNVRLWTGTLQAATRGIGVERYTPTSPLSNWGNAEGLKSGDLHYWGVWHGDSAFSSFKNNVGRFVSEYGFQSYPDSALLAEYNDPRELSLGSPAMKRLQRSYKTDKPIWDAIKRELGEEPKTLGAFIEAGQEVQAKAYRMAIEAHMAAQPHCMGTLFWQLNDCWPGPSWSLIDFEGNWKPGMYEVQRLYRR